MSAGPLVSIIVPALNEERVIGRCLRSLLQTDYPNKEIILVDDGSTDKTVSEAPPSVRVVKTAGRTGAGAARNLGAQMANGSVLMFTDADCVVPVNWVSRALEDMRTKGVLCGGGGYAGPVGSSFMQQFAFEELAYRRRRFYGVVHTLVSNNIFCEKALFQEVGGFPENYRAASSEDMIFSWKISRQHPLYWDENNGVYHDFEDTWLGYLKQQVRFARDAVPMMLGQANLMTGKTHHGKQLYWEVFLTGLFLLSFLSLRIIPPLVLLLLIVGVNANFLVRLLRRRGLGFALKSIAVILLRNCAIIWGCLEGAWKLLANRQR